MAEQYKRNYMLTVVGKVQHDALREVAEKHNITMRCLIDFIVSEVLSDEERTNEIGKILQSRQEQISIASALVKTEKLIEKEKRKAQLVLETLEARKAELEAKSSERL